MAVPTDTSTTGLLNLERELVCFICTEVLYQPLTLIDCLHTFCGACLKEWFSHQHRKAIHSHSSSLTNIYTCPTCRATVKDAQHNAMINTLLDMFLAANPNKNRSAEDKAEMTRSYKSGENILPKVDGSRRRDRRRREENDHVARERQMIEEARQRSIRDLRVDQSTSGNRLASSNGHGSSRSRERDERRERRRENERRERRGQVEVPEPAAADVSLDTSRTLSVEASTSPPPTSPRHPDAVEARQRARTVAHQASLRSLVSASENGTGTGDSLNEARLMQEILSEGLLDGINVDELTEAEQDELSEIIAERYRQLHPRRSQRDPSEDSSAMISPPIENVVTGVNEMQMDDIGTHSRHSRHPSRGNQRNQDTSSRSRRNTENRFDDNQLGSFHQSAADGTHNLSPPSTERAHRRRASDQSGGPHIPLRSRQTDPGVGRHPASRSASDITEPPQSGHTTSPEQPRQLSTTHRAYTDPRQSIRSSEMWRDDGGEAQHMQTSSLQQINSPHLSPTVNDATVTSSDYVAPITPNTGANSYPQPAELAATSNATTSELCTLFAEPAIICARCSRPNIQYEVYKHCSACNMEICQRCYRTGRGCNHWFGFGHAALVKFDASRPASRSSQAMELPHILLSRQYVKPSPESLSQRHSGSRGTMMTTTDSASRLQEGHFCDRCNTFANSCFWSCDYCNEGEWGFCNDCVNAQYCCNHPLLPIAHKSTTPNPAVSNIGTVGLTVSELSAPVSRLTPGHSPVSSLTSLTGCSPSSHPNYIQLTITTNCDLCTQPIPPSHSRYHCPLHPTPNAGYPNAKGDYDICTSCYHNRVKTGRIRREDGPAGWRKCPNGHRMIVTAFEADGDGGDRRIVIHEMVGGSRMTDEDISNWESSTAQSYHPSQAASQSSPHSARGQWTWREDSAGTRRAAKQKTPVLTQGQGKFPPEGGFGESCLAVWSYYPDDGEDGKGELAFPKNAEIREVEEINDDWWFGIYAGDGGLFPTVYVRRSGTI